MTRLFKSAAGMGLPSSRYARLGLAHTGHLQKRRYTNAGRPPLGGVDHLGKDICIGRFAFLCGNSAGDLAVCTADHEQSLLREGRPGTVSQQVFEALKIAFV